MFVPMVAAFLFGLTNKIADLMNEHGLFWFRGGALFFGILWGCLGIYLISLSPAMLEVYTALVLNWILACKLDYPNHALAGTMMILASIERAQTLHPNPMHVIWLVAAYSLTWLLQTHVRKNFPTTTLFWRLRLRIYVIPLFYGIIVGSYLPFIATLAGMAGVELVVLMFSVSAGLALSQAKKVQPRAGTG